MTLTDPAPAATQSSLSPVTCTPWCLDGDGHTDARFPEEQVCRGATVDVELTRRPLVEVSGHGWERQTIHLYLLRAAGGHTPTVEMYRGELGESVSLSLEDAEALGLALVKATLQARD